MKLPDHSVESVIAELGKPFGLTTTVSGNGCDALRLNTSKPRVLLLSGSLRPHSFSRMMTEEASRILETFGAETRIFDAAGLPLFDTDVYDSGETVNHPRVQELREFSVWSEAHVWCSPELHGNFSGVFKNQIDWLPLSQEAVRPTQGKVLAVMQVCGGSQSFNVVNNLRVLGRWMRMFVIPNQSSVPKVHFEFNSDGTMKDSPFKARLIDVMEELFKFVLLLRDNPDFLTQRFSESPVESEEQSA